MLTRLSQDSNRRLRDIAAALVTSALDPVSGEPPVRTMIGAGVHRGPDLRVVNAGPPHRRRHAGRFPGAVAARLSGAPSGSRCIHGDEVKLRGGVMSEGKIERGAAEDASGVPVTETDIEASKRPPSQPREGTHEVTSDDGSGAAGGSSGGSGGGSGSSGHPDAA